MNSTMDIMFTALHTDTHTHAHTHPHKHTHIYIYLDIIYIYIIPMLIHILYMREYIMLQPIDPITKTAPLVESSSIYGCRVLFIICAVSTWLV